MKKDELLSYLNQQMQMIKEENEKIGLNLDLASLDEEL